MEKTETTNSRSWCEIMMKGCVQYCNWFPVMGILFMGSLLLLGYCLDPEAVRVLWMTFAGIGVLMMIGGWLMMGAMMKGFTRARISGFNCPCFNWGDNFISTQDSSNEKTNCCC